MSYILFVVFVLLQLADIWTTHQCLYRGIGHEANPIMAFVFKYIGVLPGLILTKIVVIGVFSLVISVPLIVLVVDLGYLFVVYNNYKILRDNS